MQDFWLWFTTGLQHICDWNGYDHILFVTALCIPFSGKEWKQLLVLITAFTIGHSLTLALSTLNLLSLPSGLVEFLIPVTIISTCIYNIVNRNKPAKTKGFNYFITAAFGCIHGLGFSFLLKSLLGKAESITGPLFAFNIGLEAGQLLIVSVVLLISLILPAVFRFKKEQFIFFVSSAITGIALTMAVERLKNMYN